MYTYIYIYVYVYIYTHILHIYRYVYINIYIYTYIWIYTDLHIRLHTHSQTCMQAKIEAGQLGVLKSRGQAVTSPVKPTELFSKLVGGSCVGYFVTLGKVQNGATKRCDAGSRAQEVEVILESEGVLF